MTNTKNFIEKILPSKGDGSEARYLKELAPTKEIKLASETPEEEFELDVLSVLKEFPKWSKENPGKDIVDFYEEKGIVIKRIELEKGGVVFLSDYLKQKEKPKIKKIDLARGDFNKTVAGLSDSDKDLIKDLLRKSGVLVGD